MGYAELLACTNFSLLHGASHPEELIERAEQVGVCHLGVVDRDSVYGLVRAHTAAKEVGGVELVSGSMVTVADAPPVMLLVEDRPGWTSLCRLLTAARSDSQKGYASSTIEQVAEHHKGLTCVLPYGWTPERAAPLREAFGEHLEVVVTRRMSPTDVDRVRAAADLCRGLGCTWFASNQPLYATPEHKRLADVLTCIRRKTQLSAVGRSIDANDERHLLPHEVFEARYRDLEGAISRGLRIAERFAFSLDQLEYRYPPEVVPEGWTPMTWLRQLVTEGMAVRYGEHVPPQVVAQIEHELSIIEDLDFSAYFLTVYDIVRFARERGILCQGRGSAANSSVCYVLGITAVDPSRASLLFERFISKERGEPPDIDVDFEHERREEVIQYVYERYGRHRAALVNEVISYRGRSAIRDVGKVFGLSLDQVDRLAKSTDRWSAGVGASWQELVIEAGLDPKDGAVRRTIEVSRQLVGFPRHLSIHVGGFVIAEGALVDLVPVEPATMVDRTVIQWDKYDVEALHFVKVDVLGLGMLTCLRKSFELIDEHWGRALDLATVPAEDPAVYDMFCKADTVGVFQIESRAQMSMLPRLKPRCFYDLVIEVAIVRPGPIQGGMVHPYLRRRRGLEEVTYAHPSLRPILERTLGVPLFQEQVMAMAIAVGGFTAGEADELRRAMGAWRKRGRLDLIGRRLVKGMTDQGIELEYAEAIYRQILGFGEYGFPESHAASFALLVYVSGWIKCHYPAAFAAALINSQPMGFYSPRALIADARRHGVEALPVRIESSHWDCTLEERSGRKAIRIGFRLVRGLGEREGRRIELARSEAPFDSLADVAVRCGLSRGALRSLADAGAFAGFDDNRRRAGWTLQGLWTELPLFAGLHRSEPDPMLPVGGAFDTLRADYRSVGLSVDVHPMQLIRPTLDMPDLSTVTEVHDKGKGARIRVAGMVANRQRPGTANGVVFMTLEDEGAMLNLIVWPKIWKAYRKIAREQSFLGVDGVVQRDEGAISVLVERFWRIEHAGPKSVLSRDFR